MHRPLIGLMGKKGAGKDSLAGYLTRDYGFNRLAFADSLKDLAFDFDPILDFDRITLEHIRLRDYVETMGWDAAKQLPVVRRLLQRLGESMRNHAGTDVWVRALAHKAAFISEPVVVTDVRRANEIHWVKASGGLLVRVIRPGADDGDTDVSETEADSYPADITVFNTGPLFYLQDAAHDLAVSFGLADDHAGLAA